MFNKCILAVTNIRATGEYICSKCLYNFWKCGVKLFWKKMGTLGIEVFFIHILRIRVLLNAIKISANIIPMHVGSEYHPWKYKVIGIGSNNFFVQTCIASNVYFVPCIKHNNHSPVREL